MIYDRQAILGLRLRGQTHLRRLTRTEFFSRLQLIRTVEPITIEAYRQVEDERWRNDEGNSPHGFAWHESFHASQFPGDDPMACPRSALYQMMNFPTGPPGRRLRSIAQAGKSIERELVDTWHRAGILISAAPDAPLQTNFEFPTVWLTGSVDAVLKPDGWNKPLPVEVKSKYQRVIEQMRVGARGPDSKHVAQIKTQLGLVHAAQDELWPGLDPVTHGVIFYCSRDKPDETAEFRVDYDENFFEAGVEQLKRWRVLFMESYLPSINPSKKHPMGWRWSYPPCVWCPYKEICKLDHQAGRRDLTDSIGVDRTRKVWPDYDPEATRLRVFARWQGKPDKIVPIASESPPASELAEGASEAGA